MRTSCATWPVRPRSEGYDGYPLLSLPKLVALHEAISLTRARRAVACIALNTRHLADDEARAAIAAAEAETGLVADDPVRFGAGACSTPCSPASSHSRKRNISRATMSRAPRTGAQGGESGDPCGDVGNRPWAWLRSRWRGAQPAATSAPMTTRASSRPTRARVLRQMGALGLKQSVMTTRFVPSDPTTIQDGDALDRAIPSPSSPAFASRSPSIPIRLAEIEDGTATPAGFAAWLTLVAQRYPTVHQYVVMNEPNQPAFIRPQFGPTGKIVSAARAGAFLRRLRRAQGGRSDDPGDRPRPLPTRQRPATATSNVSTSRCGSWRARSVVSRRAAARCR
jgi:hypothetical protein